MRGMKDEFAWYVIIILLMFNGADTIGKHMGTKINLPDKAIYWLSFGRVVFVPTSILIAHYDKTSTKVADWMKIVNMVLFAFSNGYVCTQCSVKAPAMVKEE